MKEHKEQFFIILFLVIIGVLFLICSILIFSGDASPFISGFAIDSKDRLYIGKHNRIDVYDGKTIVNTITTNTSGAYVFTISDDKILLATSTNIYTIDYFGNIVSSCEDLGTSYYNELHTQRNVFRSKTGDKYTLHSALGWTHITKNDSGEVFRISFLSFAVKMCLYTIGISIVIFVLIIIKYRIITTGKMYR